MLSRLSRISLFQAPRWRKKAKNARGLGRDRAAPCLSPAPAHFPAATTPFPKSRASYFRFARFNTSPLYYLRAWHRLVKNGTENYISQIPGTTRITELQKIVLRGTVHTLRRSLSITVIHESYDCPKFMEWTRLHKRKEHESKRINNNNYNNNTSVIMVLVRKDALNKVSKCTWHIITFPVNFSPTSQTFLLYCWSSSVDMWSSMNLYRARLPTYR